MLYYVVAYTTICLYFDKIFLKVEKNYTLTRNKEKALITEKAERTKGEKGMGLYILMMTPASDLCPTAFAYSWSHSHSILLIFFDKSVPCSNFYLFYFTIYASLRWSKCYAPISLHSGPQNVCTMTKKDLETLNLIVTAFIKTGKAGRKNKSFFVSLESGNAAGNR